MRRSYSHPAPQTLSPPSTPVPSAWSQLPLLGTPLSLSPLTLPTIGNHSPLKHSAGQRGLIFNLTALTKGPDKTFHTFCRKRKEGETVTAHIPLSFVPTH